VTTVPAPGGGNGAAAVIGLADAAGEAASRAGRDDLAMRLQRGVDGLTATQRHVLVTGEYKRGKSSLINALLGVDLCLVDDDLTSGVPATVHHGERFEASLVIDVEGSDGIESGGHPAGPMVHTDRFDRGLRRRSIGIEGAWTAVVDPPPGVRWIEFSAPRKFLATGIVLIDVPGATGLSSSSGLLTVAASRTAALTMVLSDATQELTRSEIEALRAMTQVCPSTMLVMTKADLTRHWQRVAEINRDHLDAAGMGSVPVMATSALLRRVALDRDDPTLNERSGFPALSRRIVATVGSAAVGVDVVDQVLDVLAQLRQQHETSRRVEHEANPSSLADALVEARTRADAMRRAGARWQQVLNDEIGTMANDAEYELRGALRTIAVEMETDIADDDPASSWDHIRAGAERRVTEVLLRHDERLMARADAVASRVGEHFAAAGAALAVPLPGDAMNMSAAAGFTDASSAKGFASVELAGSGVFNSALAALRGSYGSVMMFGLVSAYAGLALINPITIVAGIGLGGKALLDDRGRSVGQRRQQARGAVRTFVDEAVVTGTKHTRDQIRSLHRELRDGFSARAEERQAGLDVAVKEAHAAANCSEVERAIAAETVRVALAEIGRLQDSAMSVRASIAQRGSGVARG